MNVKIKDMTGQKIGRLKVLRYDPNSCGLARWVCACECGKTIIVRGSSLRRGDTQSCGCLQLDRLRAKLVTHGAAPKGKPSPEYQAYHAMKKRCYYPKDKEFERYGLRGITVCDRWLSSFQNFLEDMGKRPSPGHTLDRINNEEGYSAVNCRWATRAEQSRNRRITARDGNQTIAEIAQKTGINYCTLMDRWRAGDRGERLRRSVRPTKPNK